jgi:putative ABC transport system permease protein
MALTLDKHLTDQVYYQVGADLNLAELGESTEEPAQPTMPGQPATPKEQEGEKWLFLPVSEHLQVPGVRAAARVGDYTAIARLGERRETGRLIGVDRVDFAQVAFFRRDFGAGQSLGALMNGLALGRNHLLVSRAFLVRYGLGVGDHLLLTAQVLDERAETEFIVAGVLDLFPTVYPEEGSFFVANLDYIYEQLGGMFPYDVWLRLQADADPTAVVEGVRELGLRVVAAGDARGLIVAEQSRPQRQGLFGLLTTGFLAAAGLTVLGFLLYSVVSFRRRFIELGMLRAVGLSVTQMAAFLAGEQALIILTGGAIGTGLGVWASRLFIPFLQVGPQTPPFIVRIAWSDLLVIYGIFGAMLAVAVAVLAGLLVRMRVFEAVKLGEAV